MAAPIRLGMLTPSSNTCLEPVSMAMLRTLEPNVSVHFSRFPVSRIGLGRDELAQFDFEPMLDAARLLAQAEVAVIAWGGTSGSWLGIENDQELCRRVEETTMVPATTSTLALLEALQVCGVRRYGLAVPYTKDVADKIVATYARQGFECVGCQHLDLSRNFDFDQVAAEEIAQLVSDVAPGAHAVAVVCTNLRAAPLVKDLEAALGVPVIDSVVATAWKCLDIALGGASLPDWGELAANGSLRASLQAILEELLVATDASRTTIRLDIAGRNMQVDQVVAEAVAPRVKSIRHDASLDQWAMPTVHFIAGEQRLLVQNDVSSDGPAVSPALVEVYGVQAQMLGPLLDNGRMYGWISVHQVGRVRDWSDRDIAALESACERAHRTIL